MLPRNGRDLQVRSACSGRRLLTKHERGLRTAALRACGPSPAGPFSADDEGRTAVVGGALVQAVAGTQPLTPQGRHPGDAASNPGRSHRAPQPLDWAQGNPVFPQKSACKGSSYRAYWITCRKPCLEVVSLGCLCRPVWAPTVLVSLPPRVPRGHQGRVPTRPAPPAL